MPLDLTLTPLYRLNGREQASLPGLMATTPPRKTARGRDQDRVVVYLIATGSGAVLTGETVQLASRAAVAFYETPGTTTAALRAAAESINKPLYERNVSGPGHGQYTAGMLAILAVREAQLTVLLSGPMHAYLLGAQGTQHIFDTLSGRGLGLGQTTPHYFSQVQLQADDRLLLCSKMPAAWETAVQDASPASLDATRRRFMSLTGEDVSAVLLQAGQGTGRINIQRPVAEDKAPAPEQPVAAPVPAPAASAPAQLPAEEPEEQPAQPSAYAIPAQPKEEDAPAAEEPTLAPEIVSALPRAEEAKPEDGRKRKGRAAKEPKEATGPREPSARTRQAAKRITNGMQAWRAGVARVQATLQRFMPRLLPRSEENASPMSGPALAFIAVLIPLVVVTIATVTYFRYGRSVQYDEYLAQARNARQEAVGLKDVAAQREAWQRELFYLDKAEEYTSTGDTRSLRSEAQQSLDKLQGITRLQFQPILNTGLGIQISRIAASDTDVYALDGQRGSIVHISVTANGTFARDNAFNCTPGTYGQYTVGPMVDLLAMPILNTINATVIGIDAQGDLLYCSPGQVAQAIPLPPPDTNWGRVKAIALDAGNLYVLDSQSNAVWVYVGKDGTFVDRPYFFFGGQIPQLSDAIDIAVNGDDLYILHADGRLSTCSYSRLETVPTRCVDPAALVNPFPAYRDINLFSQSHFTQIAFTPAPDSALLLLDSDSQGVFRIASRSLELQTQLRPEAWRDNPLPQGPVNAMAISPNHVLYFALQDHIYFATDSP